MMRTTRTRWRWTAAATRWRLTAAALTSAVALCCTAAGTTQAATSKGHVLAQSELSNGRTSQSTKYVLQSAIGQGATARRSSTTKYLLEGGFPATLSVSARGQPWLTAVRPAAATLRSKAALTLHGTELDLGTNPTVHIGGQKAAIVSRSRETITTVLPLQPAPGWQPVTVQNNLGTTVLPRGLAVLPLIETRPAAADGVPIELVFRGTKGDSILWAMGIGQGPPQVLSGAHFGFAILPPTFIIYTGFAIADQNGELKLFSGAPRYPTGLIYLQALFLTTNPGYAPACFSNVLNI